ncbi:hypothetical protein [Peloplasma aerotolerans]|uniref:Uncharacterized protein n=1 Tax=Peloplasma aerotolerans TaxID=3044389 RepID=A0AAW6U7H1_9MOLU|nr:hypothetical protein [Mariniplasma sp. M4Ah]MDI6452013.1 hypothetical protein [Mariniplasma sp. M4Ah]
MLEWIQELEPEFLIIFITLFFLLVFSIFTIGKVQRVLNLIGKRALNLTEDLLVRDGEDVVDIIIANTSFVNVETGGIGFVYKKVLLPLNEEGIMVLARNTHKISIPLKDLRSFVLGTSDRVKRVSIYVEDTLGRRSFKKAKNSMRMLKKIMRTERKLARKEAKRERFESGNYLFFERIGLAFKFIFSPITKGVRAFRVWTNRKFKEREVRVEIRKKEKKHQIEMQLLADEERHEKEMVEVEARINEERKAKGVDVRQAALQRKEDERNDEKEAKIASEEKIESDKKTVKDDAQKAKLNEEKVNAEEDSTQGKSSKIDEEDGK